MSTYTMMTVALAVLFLLHAVAGHDRHDHDHRRHRQLGTGAAPCATSVSIEEQLMMEEAQRTWNDKHPERARHLREGRQVLEEIPIDVYFHVIRKRDGSGFLTVSDRDAIMTRLNAGFATTGFSFVHMGTDQTTPTSSNGAVYQCFDDADHQQFRSSKHFGGAHTLNVVVCDTSGDPLVTGFATLPPSVIAFNATIDGVTIAHPEIYSLMETQETAIHEISHWLGLLHTFSSPTEASGNLQNGCNTATYTTENGLFLLSGDGCSDTPNHAGPSLDESCGLSENCCLDSNGESLLNTCPALPGRDPVKNFMNYMLAECMQKHGEFTPDQIARMIAQYETFRSPSRSINCGCPNSCTAAVLATSIDGAYTCESDIVDGISFYNNELSACQFTGSTYSQCSGCDSSNCAELAPRQTDSPQPTPPPAPVTMAPSKKPTRSALSFLACAKKVKNGCKCRGSARCKSKVIKRRCFPPLSFKAYKGSVLRKLRRLCK